MLIREQVSAHWQGDGEELALLKAVCLGDRSSLTDDMRQRLCALYDLLLAANARTNLTRITDTRNVLHVVKAGKAYDPVELIR